MALEITGKLVRVMNPVTGEGRNGGWTKQEFVIETFDQYPKKVCMSLWGDKVSSLRTFQIGDDVKASINIESREYNERWYTEVRAWRLEAFVPGAVSAQQPYAQGAPVSAPGPSYNAPQGAPSFQPAAPQGENDFFKSDESDDLPF